MQTKGEESEVKFYLTNHKQFVIQLKKTGATLLNGRTYERNLRFDNEQGCLTAADKVLRLRMDKEASLTYKGSGMIDSGISVRQELEVKVSDFDITHKLLEALGYHPFLVYEKYRTTYHMMQCEVVLDEMPFGWFCEVEGETPEAIRQVAQELGLNWDMRIVDSYLTLFQKCKNKLGLEFNDLTFENFKNIKPNIRDFGIIDSDC